jgi:hypothetical protein
MTRLTLLQIVLLSVAIALATTVVGWWAVPLMAVIWALVSKADERPALVASLAAGLGWVLLLIWTAGEGPIKVLASRAAGVMGVSVFTLVFLTVLFPMALAWSAALLGKFTRNAVVDKRRRAR